MARTCQAHSLHGGAKGSESKEFDGHSRKEHPPGALQCNAEQAMQGKCFIYEDTGLCLLHGAL